MTPKIGASGFGGLLMAGLGLVVLIFGGLMAVAAIGMASLGSDSSSACASPATQTSFISVAHAQSNQQKDSGQKKPSGKDKKSDGSHDSTDTSTSSNGCPTGGSGEYVSPLDSKKWTRGRIDMGVDMCPQGNQPVFAIGDAEITYSETNVGWPGGHFLAYRLTGGDRKGTLIYVAEHLTDLAKKGATVKAGDKIATAIPGSPCIEMGYNSSPSNDLPRAHPCYTEGLETNSGKEFARWLAELGFKPPSSGDPGKGPSEPTGPLC